MFLDYVSIVPGAAAAVMSLILMTEKISKWKKRAVIALTAIAISATGVTNWWTLREKQQEQAERSAIREQLGEFQERGMTLIQKTLDKNGPLPISEADQWD